MVEMKLWLVIVAAVALVLIAGVVAFFLGVKYRMKVAEAELGSAEEEAKRLISDAIKTKKKEALVEAKDEIYRMKNEADREVKERRSEVQRQEHRLQQKEENLDKKIDNLEKKEEAVQRRQAEADERLQEVEQIKKSQFEMLEKVSGFSKEQAKDYMLQMLENELTHEKALKITQYEQQLKEESDEKAREILSTAIQRCASDHVAEVTVSVVPLPNDEMKGRIIGREGRNIRTLENLTGVDLIIDDTPEAITLSCHDPVKREVARLSLEKLIQDGRIHPTRIEETVEKARREVETKIKQDGERAVIETGVHHLHPELMKLLGRMRYRTSYGQNVLEHSLEVSHLAGMMAAAMTLGVQKVPGCGTTIKHFACNNQEDNRMGSDSILSERALREIYLKGFEIAVKDAQPMSIMTSYNLINGVHAANCYDTCTKAARDEWGFAGAIMTDWTTTNVQIQGECTAAGCMRAGNDMVMPGLPEDHENIKKELADGTLTMAELKRCIYNTVNIVLQSNMYEGAVSYLDQFDDLDTYLVVK